MNSINPRALHLTQCWRWISVLRVILLQAPPLLHKTLFNQRWSEILGRIFFSVGNGNEKDFLMRLGKNGFASVLGNKSDEHKRNENLIYEFIKYLSVCTLGELICWALITRRGNSFEQFSTDCRRCYIEDWLAAFDDEVARACLRGDWAVWRSLLWRLAGVQLNILDPERHFLQRWVDPSLSHTHFGGCSECLNRTKWIRSLFRRRQPRRLDTLRQWFRWQFSCPTRLQLKAPESGAVLPFIGFEGKRS